MGRPTSMLAFLFDDDQINETAGATLEERELRIESAMVERAKPDVVVLRSASRVEPPDDFVDDDATDCSAGGPAYGALSFFLCGGGEEDAPKRPPLPLVDEVPLAAAREPCAICCEATADAAFLPCGHVGLCYPCALGVKARGQPCPYCRTPCSQILTVDRGTTVLSGGRACFRVTGPTVGDAGAARAAAARARNAAAVAEKAPPPVSSLPRVVTADEELLITL